MDKNKYLIDDDGTIDFYFMYSYNINLNLIKNIRIIKKSECNHFLLKKNSFSSILNRPNYFKFLNHKNIKPLSDYKRFILSKYMAFLNSDAKDNLKALLVCDLNDIDMKKIEVIRYPFKKEYVEHLENRYSDMILNPDEPDGFLIDKDFVKDFFIKKNNEPVFDDNILLISKDKTISFIFSIIFSTIINSLIKKIYHTFFKNDVNDFRKIDYVISGISKEEIKNNLTEVINNDI